MMNVGLLAALVTLVFYEGRSYRLVIFVGGLISRVLKIAFKIYRADLFETVLQTCPNLAPFFFQRPENFEVRDTRRRTRIFACKKRRVLCKKGFLVCLPEIFNVDFCR